MSFDDKQRIINHSQITQKLYISCQGLYDMLFMFFADK